MTTLILKSDKDLKKILAFAEENGIKVETKAEKNKSPYNPEFVAMVKKSAKTKGKIINPNNLWQSIK